MLTCRQRFTISPLNRASLRLSSPMGLKLEPAVRSARSEPSAGAGEDLLQPTMQCRKQRRRCKCQHTCRET